MIHRQNYLDVCAYLHHIERVRQNDASTVRRTRSHLRHLLEWADEKLFTKARAIDPTFPAYLVTVKKHPPSPFAQNVDPSGLSPASITKGLSNARQFFAFARAEWPLRYKLISESWIESLQPPRQVNLRSRLVVRQIWTLEEVLKVAGVSAETLRQERGKVAVCMLFLSGMRADALASLPIDCVDLPKLSIYQLPERGVRTKNRKAAITYLLNIPSLLEVLQSWQERLRQAALPPNALWYATLTRDSMTLTSTETAYEGRASAIADDIREICILAELPYHSPHKVRHGNAVYALKRAHDISQLKAVSQNLMHKSLVTTDSIYGNLIDNEVQQIISSL